MDDSLGFFIADKLRGIPLVSHSAIANQNKPISNGANQLRKSSTPIDSSEMVESLAKEVQVEKRDVAVDRASSNNNNNNNKVPLASSTGTSGLLFKPSAMTAATSSLIKTKKKPAATTTTRRPTTRRPATPAARTLSNAVATPTKPIKTSTSRPILAKALMKAPEKPQHNLRQNMPLKMAPSEPPPLMMITFKPTSSSSSSSSLSSSNGYTKLESVRQLASVVEYIEQENAKTTTTNLTKATQQLPTTQPGYQRRTPQTVTTQTRGYTNKLNGVDNGRSFAGENWTLFNKPDGQMSVFEIMVLMSSIMIVSTVVLVILFNWIKSFQKKRNPHKENDQDKLVSVISNQQQQVGSSPISTSDHQKLQHFDGLSDRMSKMSMNTSIPTTASVSDTSPPTMPHPNLDGLTQQAKQISAELSRKSGALAGGLLADGASKEPANTPVADPALNHKQISNEFKGSQQIGLVNKAMAIVQPTENNDPISSHASSSETDKFPAAAAAAAASSSQHQQQKIINRSVSDLSGKRLNQEKPIQQVKSIGDQVATNDGKRVAALEELFNSSTPNINLAGASSEGAMPQLDKTQSASIGKGLEGGKSVAEVAKHHLSQASSLDSVELPETLVESIKRTTSSNGKADAPSPNLLLGPEALEQVAVVAAEKLAEQLVKPNFKTDTLISSDKSKEIKKPSLETRLLSNDQSEKKKSVNSAGKPRSDAIASSKPISMNTTTRQPVTQPDQDLEKTTKSATKKAPAKDHQPEKESQTGRPENPMGRDASDKSIERTRAVIDKGGGGRDEPALEIKNHQVVVNKLDKRKTNLEIVDLRDESVTGKMRVGDEANDELLALGDDKTTSGWISMDGVAVAQAVPSNSAVPIQYQQQQQQQRQQQQAQSAALSPSEIIESKFHVDYRRRRAGHEDSIDSKQEEYIKNDIDNELEQDNKMKNRKYFVYVVHDGHFTAKKECIARIELPQKRRITLAEMRQLIANSQDISLSSLRRNRFKFVTETYRLLNENEDSAVLHQVYPTQGVFLKLNIPEQEGQAYHPFKSGRAGPSGGARLSSNSGATPSSLSQATIASRRRANNTRAARQTAASDLQTGGGSGSGTFLPAIEVGYGQSKSAIEAASSYGRTRASSVGRKTRLQAGARPPVRSKSSVQTGARNKQGSSTANRLPTIGRLANNNNNNGSKNINKQLPNRTAQVATRAGVGRGGAGGLPNLAPESVDADRLDLDGLSNKLSLGSAATDLGANVLSGAKRLFNATFNR